MSRINAHVLTARDFLAACGHSLAQLGGRLRRGEICYGFSL